MKKTSITLAVLCILSTFLLCTNANAQSTNNNFRFGIGIDGLVPVGNLTNTSNFGLGITPKLQYTFTDKFALTFTSGFYDFFGKKISLDQALGVYGSVRTNLEIIPVKAGARYFVTPDLYLAGEAGVGLEVENGGGPADLLLSPAIGYASKHWDVSLRYENLSANGGSVGFLGLRVAYGFGL